MKLNEVYNNINKRRSTVIEEEKAIEFMKRHCKRALAFYNSTKTRVYRGIEHPPSSDILFNDSTLYKRTSIEENSYHIHFIDATWPNSFPKRSKSIFANAQHFRQGVFPTKNMWGSLFIVVPSDDVKIGFNVVGHRHLFDAFENIHGFNIQELAQRLKFMKIPDSPQGIERLKNVPVKQVILGKHLLSNTNFSSAYDYIASLFDPKVLHYKPVSFNQIDSNFGEVFLSGKSILLRNGEESERLLFEAGKS